MNIPLSFPFSFTYLSCTFYTPLRGIIYTFGICLYAVYECSGGGAHNCADRGGILREVCYTVPYHRLTRADTVLTGRNAPILRQTPWQYGKYYLRAFSCLDTFLLRQNCCAPASDVFSSDFWLLRCRRAESAYSRRCCRATFLWSEAGARQDEKDKKRRKDTLSGVFALVNRW